jgi:hypothetical protein
MTQDQPGQAEGTGSVVPGQTVPDHDTDAAKAGQPGPVTRLKKAASALRGDKPDQTVPDDPVPGQTATGPGAPDPDGSWPAHPGGEGAMNSTVPRSNSSSPSSTRCCPWPAAGPTSGT